MKYKFTLLISMALIAISSFGQKAVALHSADGVQIFSQATAFADAMEAATDGDTLYLSGGSFPAVNINKGVRIYGAGICPDSSLATLPTQVSGNVQINAGADSLFVEGVVFLGSVRFMSEETDTLFNITFKRCLLKGEFWAEHVNSPRYLNCSFFQSVFDEFVALVNLRNSIFANCIFNKNIVRSTSNIFTNNHFLSLEGYYLSDNMHNNVFKNNIFRRGDSHIMCTGSDPSGNVYNAGNEFFNNVFVASSPVIGESPIYGNNYKEVSMDSIFVNPPVAPFTFNQDYHLKPAAAEYFLGDDGTPIGVYGGFAPLKTGFVPSNPHISSKFIPGATDDAGNLHIQMRINAQED